MSADTFDLVGAAMRCIRAGWKGDPSGNGHGYTKAGIILDDLFAKKTLRVSLFEPERPRKADLMKALDAVNDRFGRKTIVIATEGFQGRWGPQGRPSLAEIHD